MSQAFLGDLTPALEPRAPGSNRAHDRRATDPIDRLGRQFNAICTEAVDHMQIAAALESEGFTDSTVQARFGVASVFELAQQLFDRIPLRIRHLEVAPAARLVPWRELSHGLLFALPAAFYPVLVSQAGQTLTAVAITVAVVVGWSWSQFMVRASYLMRGSGSAASATNWLRFSSLAGVAFVGAIAAVMAWQYDWPVALIAVAVGQMSYHMAAAILIHYQREGRLLLYQAPGLLAGIAYLSAPGSVSIWLATGVIGLSLVASLVAALSVRPAATEATGPRRSATPRELLEAAPFLFYGLACALLVTHDSLRFRDWIGGTAFGLTLAPLVLSMGLLEWLLRAFRERVAASLAISTSTRSLARMVWTHFVASLAIYASLLGVLSAGSYLLIRRTGEDLIYLSSTLAANWVLGCAFFVGFALISQNRIALVARFATLALVVHLLHLTENLPFVIPGAEEGSSYLLACLIFVFFLLSVARKVLFEVRNYTYDLHLSRQARIKRPNNTVRRAT